MWVSEPSYPVLWVLCKSMNFDPDKQLLQVACDRIEPLTLGQGQHSTPTSQGTHCQTKLYCYIQCARLRAFRSCGWQRATGAIGFLRNFYAIGSKQCPTRRSGKKSGFLEPDKIIMLHSVCAAQSLPILRMAACHRSHRIPSQLLWCRSKTMSNQCNVQEKIVRLLIFWSIFGARQNYNVTFSLGGSELSNPADGSVPTEPSDSFVTPIFWSIVKEKFG